MQTRQSKVTINGIWFSVDGSIRETVLNNYQNLAEQITQSGHRHDYELVLWTDSKKLLLEAKEALEKLGVRIQDYRQIDSDDEVSKKILRWVDGFVQLGKDKDKLPFAIASDILRMFLLTKMFPKLNPHDIFIYIDCNDITFTRLPDPDYLKNMLAKDEVGLALPVVGFDFHPEIRIDPHEKETMIINNDVIIVYPHGHEESLEYIFQCHLRNLEYMERTIQQAGEVGILSKYKQSQQVLIETEDHMLAESIEFSLAHTINFILFLDKEDKRETYLFLWHDDGQVDIKKIALNEAVFYLDFVRDSKKGFSWRPPLNAFFQPSTGLSDNQSRDISKSWQDIFLKKHKLMLGLLLLYVNKIDMVSFNRYLIHHKQAAPQLAQSIVQLTEAHDSELLMRKFISGLEELELRIKQSYAENEKKHIEQNFSFSENLAKGMLYVSHANLFNDQIYRLLLDNVYQALNTAKCWVDLQNISPELCEKVIEIGNGHPQGDLFSLAHYLLTKDTIENHEEYLKILSDYSIRKDKLENSYRSFQGGIRSMKDSNILGFESYTLFYRLLEENNHRKSGRKHHLNIKDCCKLSLQMLNQLYCESNSLNGKYKNECQILLKYFSKAEAETDDSVTSLLDYLYSNKSFILGISAAEVINRMKKSNPSIFEELPAAASLQKRYNP